MCGAADIDIKKFNKINWMENVLTHRKNLVLDLHLKYHTQVFCKKEHFSSLWDGNCGSNSHFKVRKNKSKWLGGLTCHYGGGPADDDRLLRPQGTELGRPTSPFPAGWMGMGGPSMMLKVKSKCRWRSHPGVSCLTPILPHCFPSRWSLYQQNLITSLFWPF